MNKKIGFIGVGNMGRALIKGLLKKKIVEPQDIIVSDIDKNKLRVMSCELHFCEHGQVTVVENNRKAVEQADIIILAVKPKDMGKVLKEINDSLTGLSFPVSGTPGLIISIAAGITTAYIEEHLEKNVPVIRVMPNTPALIGEGMTVISPGRSAHEEEKKIAEEIFRGVGETAEVAEDLMEAVTALSGSGPAYIFMIMESLAQAGVSEGLPSALAQRLVGQTVLGAVKIAVETGEKLSLLREKVTSPGGTTEAALKVFRERGLEDILAGGVRAAAERAKELSA